LRKRNAERARKKAIRQDILIGGKTLLDKLKPNAARNAVGQMKIGKRGMVERAGQYLG
jgi:hypothetical protein